MEVKRDRISIRQAIILFMLALGAPSLRVVPNYVANNAEQASWISPFFALIPCIFIVLILASLFRKNDGGLYDVYEKIFGKYLNKIITVIYIGWCIFLAAFYLRMSGERFIETILFDANAINVITIIAIISLFVVNQKLDVIGRMSEILTILFLAIIFLVFFLILPNIKIGNLLPVTHYDFIPILKGGVPLISLAFYITVVMFLGDKISQKERLRKVGSIAMIILTTVAIMIILSTVGLMGYRTNVQLLFPYFSTLKNIQILNTFERVEPLFISTWLAADVIIVSLFTMVSLHLIKRLFNFNSTKKASPYLLFAILLIANFFTKNVYQAEVFSQMFLGYVNIFLFGVVPFIALIVGRIRGRV